jgi:hypothetical protein
MNDTSMFFIIPYHTIIAFVLPESAFSAKNPICLPRCVTFQGLHDFG